MKKSIFVLVTVLLSKTAIAAQQERTVQYIESTASNGAIFFHMHSSEGWVGNHECNSGGTGVHWVIQNPDTNIGKNQIALLMVASATGKTITVASSDNNCVAGIAGGKGFKVEILKIKM